MLLLLEISVKQSLNVLGLQKVWNFNTRYKISRNLNFNPLFSLCNFYILGPTVHLGAKSVNFMQIDLGVVATRTVDIVNNSAVEATFQVLM